MKSNHCATFAVLFWMMSCGSSQSGAIEPSCCAAEAPPVNEATEVSTAPRQASSQGRPVDCTRLEASEDAPAQFADGKRLIEACDEACMKSEEMGDERLRGMQLLKEAAQSGNLDAQSFYGRAKFGDLMTTGSDPGLRAEYVEALRFLALAAWRGDAAAVAALPQLESLRLDQSGRFSQELTQPLSYLEEEWVVEALSRASADLECFSD